MGVILALLATSKSIPTEYGVQSLFPPGSPSIANDQISCSCFDDIRQVFALRGSRSLAHILAALYSLLRIFKSLG